MASREDRIAAWRGPRHAALLRRGEALDAPGFDAWLAANPESQLQDGETNLQARSFYGLSRVAPARRVERPAPPAQPRQPRFGRPVSPPSQAPPLAVAARRFGRRVHSYAVRIGNRVDPASAADVARYGREDAARREEREGEDRARRVRREEEDAELAMVRLAEQRAIEARVEETQRVERARVEEAQRVERAQRAERARDLAIRNGRLAAEYDAEELEREQIRATVAELVAREGGPRRHEAVPPAYGVYEPTPAYENPPAYFFGPP
jgi:hypothetical protein